MYIRRLGILVLAVSFMLILSTGLVFANTPNPSTPTDLYLPMAFTPEAEGMYFNCVREDDFLFNVDLDTEGNRYTYRDQDMLMVTGRSSWEASGSRWWLFDLGTPLAKADGHVRLSQRTSGFTISEGQLSATCRWIH